MYPTLAIIDRTEERILMWINNNLNEFDIFKNPPIIEPLKAKALIELAFMCMFYIRYKDINTNKTIKSCFDHLLNVSKNPLYRERLVRCPSALTLYGTLYVVMYKSGYDDKEFRMIFQNVLDQGYSINIERVSFRKMDLNYLLECGEFLNNLTPMEDLFEETLLSKNPPLLYLHDHDVYAITHALFYLTDFGNRPFPKKLEAKLDNIRKLISMLLGIYIRENNMDLVGELLICCSCIDLSPPLLYEIAWEAIIKSQIVDGSIPGPSFSICKFDKLSTDERKIYCFENSYHTTLVTFIACLVAEKIMKEDL
jgi:hypothetical protein